MNSLGFGKLIFSFYGKKLPSLYKIQKKGLLAVKVAQHYALRIDFLEEEMCSHLSQLYAHSFSAEERTLSELLEGNTAVLENLASWDEKPFSSASVGQVHRGTLKSGEKVAIKVIRSNFKESFFRDISRIERSVSMIGRIWPKFNKIFDPGGILENIKGYTSRELDLVNEYMDMEKLRSIRDGNLKYFDLKSLDFPRVYKELSSERILVSDYIEGDTFDHLLAEGRLTYENLLELFRVHSFYIFNVGIFHGDIHPGNIILGNDGKLYFLDCAGLSTISPRLRKGLFWFFYYLSRYDYPKAAENLNKMSEKPLDSSSYRIFLEKFMDLYSDFTHATVSQVSLTRRMMETIKLGINSGMDFGSGMFPVIKSLMYLDGMVMRCNPQAVLMEDVRGFTDILLEQFH
ncbi:MULTISPECIES: AarF/ABC1/UbiB kinase family protein [Psychrilyobacter]|uniref:AarF/ABC1/UbiB kinase family protein n=1 Tax=Psychrilyobacter piezotolerans TaxID=2293438 RepID=A0ABX9KJE9_9FUSO|nr:MULTISPECIES: AarF/ABC1/UbiB kinase family protein [Psychrilyobacter]MCS5421742.1 AarF/ABC1/UbiB kinase family protein [Psychrilyobacter sp. S5]NDI77047.1 AarF/ABC1/UbiB kinase family protein [Psychrilyobacter piezotolerans]RDE64664.1 AarF/ABC1/UbiB kinase family protein [Psychrilyobacter sp. S5]REI42476.1 AarF/ABC1/UbiB kinase family protein [Psychrilyobacter piezotolerans]